MAQSVPIILQSAKSHAQAVNLQMKLTIKAAVQLAPDICNWQTAIANINRLINRETRRSLSNINGENISNPRTTGIQ